MFFNSTGQVFWGSDGGDGALWFSWMRKWTENRLNAYWCAGKNIVHLSIIYTRSSWAGGENIVLDLNNIGFNFQTNASETYFLLKQQSDK